MSQHGCPERLSNRSKGFQEDGSNQPTMEVLVETLTGTAFEMTVSPSDTIFAIKSKIFRVEGIPVSQQHLLYNLKELDDASSLCELSIADGARLRLVLGMRGGPISTRRLPPPAPANSEPWPDIERLLDSNRDDIEWTSNGCKVTVLVFRDGERVNMLRVRENHDGSYSPLETKYSGSGAERPGAEGAGGAGVLHENAVTMGKMLELRNRMEALTLQRTGSRVEIQKTRSEETLPGSLRAEAAPYVARGAFAPCLDNNYTRCGRGPRAPSGALHGARRTREDEDGAILEECLGDMRASPPRDFGALAAAPLHAALLSSSAADLDTLRRHSRILPALSRARVRSHLHLSDEGLHLTRREPLTAPPVSLAGPPVSLTGSPGTIAGPPDPPPPPAAEHKEKKIRVRCSWCRKRLSVAAVHECRCGASFCAPHRYAEVHGCAYDYKRQPRLQPRLQAPKLPKI